VLAAIGAVCDEAFNIHGINATTWGITPCLIVNGPVRKRLNINAGVNALGHGHRANATIGRAVKLALRNIGGAKPGGIEQATLGSPAKYTFCFAELEEGSPWPSLAIERGFGPGEDVVTCFAAEAPRFIADQGSRTARQLAASLGLAVEACMHPRLRPYGDAVLVICPEHAEVFRRDGWSKADLRARIQEVTARPLREVLRDAECGEGIDSHAFGPAGPNATQLETRMPKFASPANIHIVVAGGAAGKFSAVLGGWGVTAGRTALVSRRI